MEYKCLGCGKKIERTNRQIRLGLHKYCNRQCFFKYGVSKPRPTRMTGEWFNCIVCGKEFYKTKTNIKTGACKYCSQSCYRKVMREKEFPNLTHNRKKLDNIICAYCGKEFSPKTSKTKYCDSTCYHNATKKPKVKKVRRSDWNSWKKGKPLSKSNAQKIRRGIIKHYDKVGRVTNRKKHSLWRYKNWTKKVLKRDGFTCQDCGRRGGQLQVHHIKSWAKYPKERYWLKNGVTLCLECHWKRHPKMPKKMFGL